MASHKATVQILLPFALAAKERARLFGGLESFANLGDSAKDYEKFALQWPTFYPVEIRKGGPLGKPMGLIPELHLVVLLYRDYLRRAWISDPEVDRLGLADILLGLQTEVAQPAPESAGWANRPKLLSLKPMIDSVAPHDSDQDAAPPKVVASWKWGEFNYYPLTDFQRAFYLLFREKWRARICAQCARYFIADKPPQRYCLPTCNGMAKRKQALNWWRTIGDARRRVRMRKTGKMNPTARQKRRLPSEFSLHREPNFE
jgi:hypothetical protein